MFQQNVVLQSYGKVATFFFSMVVLCSVSFCSSTGLVPPKTNPTRPKPGISFDVITTKTTLLNADGISFDQAGNLFIADTDHHQVKKVDATTGIETILAGTGKQGNTGDGGPAINATLYCPTRVVVNQVGTVYILDTLNPNIS